MLDQTIILDTETTGIDPLSDRIVELAAIPFYEGPEFSMLCNPGRGIPPEAMAIHHITEDMVRAAVLPERACQSMFEQLGVPDLVVAHNAKFDRGFMNPIMKLRPTWLCTFKCAQVVWPDAPGHSNQVLRYWLGLNPAVPEGLAPHRALYDIIVTREILKALLARRPLEELVEISNKPVLLKKVSFGKHKGKTWSQVDKGYLQWILRQEGDMNEDVVYTARYYLNGGRS